MIAPAADGQIMIRHRGRKFACLIALEQTASDGHDLRHQIKNEKLLDPARKNCRLWLRIDEKGPGRERCLTEIQRSFIICGGRFAARNGAPWLQQLEDGDQQQAKPLIKVELAVVVFYRGDRVVALQRFACFGQNRRSLRLHPCGGVL
jgi:hypothetical protein